MIGRLFLTIVVLGVVCLQAAGGQEPGYVGLDSLGGDIASAPASSAAACALQCDQNAGCTTWAWAYPGPGCPTNDNTCWLKNGNTQSRIATPCREIGYSEGVKGLDRVGGDMDGMPLVLGNGGPSGPSACALACKSRSGCVAWAFDSCGQPNCWLKSSITGSNSNGCRISGVQGNLHTDMVGNDLGNAVQLASDATTTECSDLCSRTPGCSAWSFVLPGPNCENVNNCWLKTSGGSTSASSCRSSLTQPAGIAPPPPPPSGPQCGNGNVCHYNKCGFTADIVQVGNGGAAPFKACSIGKGQSCDTNVPSGWAGNFKIGFQGQSLAEFQINGWNNIDYYDISYIVGFDFGMSIQSTNGGKFLNCPQFACGDAYHLPDDVQTHTTPTNGKFIVTWCP